MVSQSQSHFHQKYHVSEHVLLSHLSWGFGPLSILTCILTRFNKDDILADLSRMNIDHSVWIMAQVPPCETMGSNNVQGHFI